MLIPKNVLSGKLNGAARNNPMKSMMFFGMGLQAFVVATLLLLDVRVTPLHQIITGTLLLMVAVLRTEE